MTDLSKANQVKEQIMKGQISADSLLLGYLNEVFAKNSLYFKTATVKTDYSTALNSINGTCTTVEGTEYFYKFHTEENETLSNKELYNAHVLIDIGWNMLSPIATSSSAGMQCVLYPLVNFATVFSVLDKLDRQYIKNGFYDGTKKKQVLDAIKDSVCIENKLLLSTFKKSDETLPYSVIHQLFSHRLIPVCNEEVRVDKYYGSLNLGHKWIINGKSYGQSIEQLILQSKKYLAANFSKDMASVIAHGDDHFANQFLCDDKIMYFDPAFAGKMPALLAHVKATAHNIFAHPLWLYNPEDFKKHIEFKVEFNDKKNLIMISHNWDYKTVSPIRAEILELYVTYIWKPMLSRLKEDNALPDWWKEYLRCALFCSPFLAKNIFTLDIKCPDTAYVMLGILIQRIDQFIDQLECRVSF